MKKLLLTLLMFVPLLITAQDIGGDYYVAVDGNDSGPGTYDRPWGTWQKAFSTAQAGETVYFRGGVWYPQEHAFGNAIVIVDPELGYGNTGTREAPIKFFNYPGEVPILDCSQVDMTGNRFNSALDITRVGWYHLKGLTVRNVIQPTSQELACGIGNGITHNMIFENMTIHDVGGRGMTYWGVAGHPEYPEIPTDTTRFINCDIYDCVDLVSSVPGNGSDGCKMDAESGTYLYFYGCRAWGNGDDGFDISGPGRLIFDNCWAFNQGFAGALDGNGFKYGANRGIGATQDAIGNTHVGPNVTGVRRVLKNCIAAGNLGLGLYDLAYAPYYPNESRVYNNSLYNNGISISISINDAYNGITPPKYYNNIAYKPVEITAAGYPYILSVGEFYETYNNTFRFAPAEEVGSLPWFRINETYTVTDDDFISLNVQELKSPRKPDGSLPDVNFMKLVAGSDLIDAGLDLETVIASELRAAGIDANTYLGAAPDLGAFEYVPNDYKPIEITDYTPNKTADIVSVTYYSPQAGTVSITATDDTGNQFIQPSDEASIGQNNQVEVDLSGLAAGVYTIRLSNGNSNTSCTVTKLPDDVNVTYKIVKSFPNPTIGLFAIQFTCSKVANITVTVTDEVGQTMLTDYFSAKPNLNKMVLNLAPLLRGNYKINLDNGVDIISTTVTKQ